MINNYFGDIFLSFWQIIAYVLKAFLPLFIGLIIAYILNGPVELIGNKFKKATVPHINFETPKGRFVSILVAYILSFVLLFSIILAFVILMLGSLPQGDILSTLEKIYTYVSSSDLFDKWFEKYVSAEKLVDLASVVVSFAINIFLGIVVSIYLLKDKEFFLMQWQKFLSIVLSQRIHGLVNEILHEINVVIFTFIKGALIDSIIVALLSSIALSILNIKYAVIIGGIGGLLNVIPYFGPFFSMVPAFLVTLSNQGLTKALIAVSSLFVVQQLDSNYVYPKIVGTSIGLHPLYVLLSVSVMGYFLGVVGMLIAVPIAGVIQVLVKKWAYSK